MHEGQGLDLMNPDLSWLEWILNHNILLGASIRKYKDVFSGAGSE